MKNSGLSVILFFLIWIIITLSANTAYGKAAASDFSVRIITEKEKLLEAIAEAKTHGEINIDTAVAMNKKKQLLAKSLDSLSQIKPSAKTTQGIGFRFNINNEQVRYFYDIEEITSIDFDRSNVRNLSRKYMKETDETSARLDNIEISTIVDFIPQWDVNDHFEDLVPPSKATV